jgi:hypothetical protein
MARGAAKPIRQRQKVLATIRKLEARHRLGEGVVVLTKSVLGGLHHEYSMAPSLA